MWLRMTGISAGVPRARRRTWCRRAAAAEALITARTRAIVLVTPGNPTGVTIPPAVIAEFAALAARHGIALVLDETYRSFRDTDEPAARPVRRSRRGGDTVVSLHSFSKDLAIPGYRVGAVVAVARELNREVMKLLDCVAIGAPRVGQEAAWAGPRRPARQWRRGPRRARSPTGAPGSPPRWPTGRAGSRSPRPAGSSRGCATRSRERPTEDVVRELVVGAGPARHPGHRVRPGRPRHDAGEHRQPRSRTARRRDGPPHRGRSRRTLTDPAAGPGVHGSCRATASGHRSFEPWVTARSRRTVGACDRPRPSRRRTRSHRPLNGPPRVGVALRPSVPRPCWSRSCSAC